MAHRSRALRHFRQRASRQRRRRFRQTGRRGLRAERPAARHRREKSARAGLGCQNQSVFERVRSRHLRRRDCRHAVSPAGITLVTDQTLNLAYAFIPAKPGTVGVNGKKLGPYDYEFKGTRFGEQGFDKLGGIAIDSRGRIYAVDAHLNDVRRFNTDGSVDPGWKFEKARVTGDTYLHGCEGIAIDEANGNLFIASEKDAVIQIFDWETGKYKGNLIGATADAAGKPGGQKVFSGSVEGLAIAGNY